MKGISEVIALILMLVITIALAGTAYLYISGIFTTQTQAIEVADAFCNTSTSGGNIIMSIRNLGSSAVTSITCTRTAPGTPGPCSIPVNLAPCNSGAGNIPPGQSCMLSWGVDLCSGNGTRSCQYRLTANIGRTISTQVTCT